MSVSKYERAKAYAAARDAVRRRSEGRCEARAFHGCTGVGEHAHHVRRRSQGGSDDPSNLLWTCPFCHQWVHEHPLLSARAGLLWSRREDTAPHPSLDLVPCVCGDWVRVVPCYRCELEDARHE